MEQFTLLQLTELIRATLDTSLEPSYWVVAEIGELREHQRGHCYLTLIQKEEDDVKAKVRANIWAYQYRNIGPWFATVTGQSLKPGMQILANVQVQYHPVFGLSLNVRDIDPNFTLGERARRRQAVIEQLRKEEVFDQNKSLPLPLVPQRIAVISSPTAAGYGDFNDQLHNNNYGYRFKTTLYKASMQGDEAVGSIRAAMKRIAEKDEAYDVLVIIRGGGSQVDLDCFDTYDLALAIATFPLPVFTGIGHERDETIADIVAHTRLKTPTAVSEFLISGMITFEQRLLENLKRLQVSSDQRIENQLQGLRNKRNMLSISSQRLIMDRLHYLRSGLSHIRSGVQSSLRNGEQKLENFSRQVRILNPESTLKRGYTLTTHNRKRISNFEGLKKGDRITTYSASGEIDSTIEKIKKRQ